MSEFCELGGGQPHFMSLIQTFLSVIFLEQTLRTPPQKYRAQILILDFCSQPSKKVPVALCLGALTGPWENPLPPLERGTGSFVSVGLYGPRLWFTIGIWPPPPPFPPRG